MLKKYVSKFAMDILPSVAATIIGAYIVNHYIVTKPAASTPAVAAVSTAEPQAGAKVAPEAAKAGSQPPETSSDVANIPEAGVKAKGISEKAMIEKTAAEKPIMVEKPVEKSADKPAETASIPAGTRRYQPAPRAVAKAVPAPVRFMSLIEYKLRPAEAEYSIETRVLSASWCSNDKLQKCA